MKIFTTDGIKRIDEATVESENISSLDLMERAASAVAYEIVSRWRPSKRIVIFAGPGNNGGDALAVARILLEQGYAPEVYLFNIKSSHLSRCCSVNCDRLKEMGAPHFIEVVDTFTPPELGPGDVVIDGPPHGWIFGFGAIYQRVQGLCGGYRHAIGTIWRVEHGGRSSQHHSG